MIDDTTTRIGPTAGAGLLTERLHEAAQTRRLVRATCQFRGERGRTTYRRLWEPYGIRDGHLLVFSYFRDEFRRVPLESIVDIVVTDETFRPRRSVEF